jgi:integrase
MMNAMPKPLPPHVTRETTRHGRTVFYFRRYPGPRIRLRSAYGTPEWAAEYHAAMTGQEVPAPVNKAASGSLRWLWDRYRETSAWAKYTPPTRKQRENIMRHVLDDNGGKAGATPFLAISRTHIVSGRDRRKDTPNQARHFLDTMHGMFAWALDAGHVKVDPTAGVKPPQRKKGGGFKPWSEDEVQQFERKYPLGTRQRVWLDVYLYTGLRRGDAARVGRQHMQRTQHGEVLKLATEKSQGEVTVEIPILPVLRATLDAGPVGDLTFCVGARGKPFTAKESLGNAFSDDARKAGIIGKSPHGLRKVAAMRCAYNGANVAQMNAIFGWRGAKMAMHYIEAAERARLARDAMTKMLPQPNAG